MESPIFKNQQVFPQTARPPVPIVAASAPQLLYGLIVTAKMNDVISIARMAKLLDEDGVWLERLAKEMGPEDGGLSLRSPPYSNAASIGRRKPSANRLV